MKILLLGLGRANQSVAPYLLRQHHDVFVYEEHIAMLPEHARDLLETGALKTHHRVDYDLVISSPGFPPDKDIVRKLQAKNIRIIDEIEFTYQQLTNPAIIAITGTNGKSTTAALVSAVLRAAGKHCFLGGNISPGIPFSHVLELVPYEYYVLEVSSFQLTRIEKFRPRVAVLTNIAVDHLNWHKDFAEYKDAKFRIFSNQTPDDFAVVNYEDEHIRQLAESITAQRVYFGLNAKTGAWLNGDFCYREERLFRKDTTALKGKHNMMNILAAIAATEVLGITPEKIREGIAAFTTLPHRLEDIGTVHGVRYINNSMCTNEEAAIASFNAVEGNKIVIVGGKQKGDAGTNYLHLLAQQAKACVILGDNAPQIARYFKTHSFTAFAIARTMDEAVKKARSFAKGGDVILLNPGYASFDYFTNFEERGEAFKHAAHGD